MTTDLSSKCHCGGVSGGWIYIIVGERRGRGGGRYFVTLIDELMGSSDELEAIHVVEFRGYFVPK